MNPLPYQALALDLDGTLLGMDGRLEDATAAILRALSARGLRIILASGRMTARILPFADQLGVPMDLVTYNGAEVLSHGPRGWMPLSSRGLSSAAREAVYALSRTHGIFLNIYSRGELHGYHTDGDFTWSKHYETHSGATYAGKHTRLSDLPREGIQKFLVMAPPVERDRLHDSWSPLLADHCALTKSNPEYLEIVAKDVSKGTALRSWLDHTPLRIDKITARPRHCPRRSTPVQLLERLSGRGLCLDTLPARALVNAQRSNGVPATGLLAFGDAENDLEMLRLAGLGIAMANATPGLRAEYGRLSGRFSPWTNAQSGVARELAGLFGVPLS